jgi:hypothetical protein
LITIATTLITGAATVGVAHAGDEFLLTDDLPADPTWVAGSIEEGEPEIEEFCAGEVIQPEGTRHRVYNTDLDTFAREHIIVSATEAKAQRLQHQLNRAIRNCAEAWEAENPGGSATFKRYGKGGIADGVAVYGVFVEEDFGALSANLFAVGRDRTDVAVVRYGRIGREADVPVRAFERTARRAVAHLVP